MIRTQFCPIGRACMLFAFAGLMNGACAIGRAQNIPYRLPGDVPPRVKKHKTPDKLPPVPTLAPAFSIPVAPLGYGAPGPTYLGRHQSLVALTFLDEDRLLFSFRASGLLERGSGDDGRADAERKMRAVVLSLPDGKVEAQTVWTLPDRGIFVWSLSDGRLLLRGSDGLEIVNSKLESRPLVQIPGQFLSLDISPEGKYLVASSIDPTAHFDGPPPRAKLSLSTEGQPPRPANIAARLVEVDSGHVLQTKRSNTATQAPINSEGYLETRHDKLDQWTLTVHRFSGDDQYVGHVESTCLPTTFFASEHEVLVGGCTEGHVPKLMGVSAGQQLWQDETPIAIVPPLFAFSRDGSRFARETIVFKHPPSAGEETLWINAVQGQVVRIFDSATGKVVMETPISPTFDAGGNMALSPSGRRLVVLNENAIQVFDLPAAAR
jgi:hypothetical protein